VKAKVEMERLLREALLEVPRFSGAATIQFRINPRRYVVTMPDGSVLEVGGGSEAALRKAKKAVAAWCDDWTREHGGQSIMVIKTTVVHWDDETGGAR
jgi:hypothetical protein